MGAVRRASSSALQILAQPPMTALWKNFGIKINTSGTNSSCILEL